MKSDSGMATRKGWESSARMKLIAGFSCRKGMLMGNNKAVFREMLEATIKDNSVNLLDFCMGCAYCGDCRTKGNFHVKLKHKNCSCKRLGVYR